MKLTWILVSVVAVAQLVLPSFASAQETGVSVTPAIIERALAPGEQTEASLQIRNNSGQAIPMSLQPQPFIPLDDIRPRERELFDASRWIKFDSEVYLFGPDAIQTIPFFITVPPEAAAGGHYAFINVRALTLEGEQQDKSTRIIPEVSVRVLFTVSGDIDNTLLTRTKNIFPWYASRSEKVTTRITIENTGNVHNLVSPVFVLRKDDQDVLTQTYPPQLLLPDSEKEFMIEWSVPDTAGRYDVLYFENSRSEVPTRSESLFVGPRLLVIVLLAIITWVGLYSMQFRSRLVRAWRILTTSH